MHKQESPGHHHLHTTTVASFYSSHRLRLQLYLRRLRLHHRRPHPRSPPRLRLRPPGLMSLAQDAVIVRAADGRLHSTAFQVYLKPETGAVMQWLQQLRTGDGDGNGGSGAANEFTRTLLSTVGILPPNQPEQGQAAAEAAASDEAAVAAAAAAAAAAEVQVFVNDLPCPALAMAVDAKGSCSFVASGNPQPAPSMLAGLTTLLRPGRNDVRFEHGRAGIVVQASIWLWDADATLVVSDIDGTISRSDVKGYVETVHMQRYEYTHAGVCRLYSHLANAHGVHFLYLTSRPLSLLPATRAYIAGAEQDGGHRLPAGPIMCSPYSLARVLYKELIEKTIRAFKQSALESVADAFHRAGRPRSRPVFAAGFGNKTADALAYRGAGVPADAIFIINAQSEVRRHAAGEEGEAAAAEEEEEEEEERRTLLRGGVSSYYRSRLQELRRQMAGEGEKKKEAGEPQPVAAVEPVAAVTRVTMDRTATDIDKTEEAGSASSSLSPFSSYGDARLLQALEAVLSRDRAPCHHEEAFSRAPPAAASVGGDG